MVRKSKPVLKCIPVFFLGGQNCRTYVSNGKDSFNHEWCSGRIKDNLCEVVAVVAPLQNTFYQTTGLYFCLDIKQKLKFNC